MEMDVRWSIFSSTYSYEIFCEEAIPKINLKKEVPKDVQDSFRVIRKLLEHSYYEYEFYDVADLKTLLTFEMALKFRYKELTNTDWGTKPLEKLIKWFHSRTYFEVFNDTFLDHLRILRNMSAHPERNNIGGPMNRQWILNIVDLINDLYEDPMLRITRMQLMRDITSKMKELCTLGLRVAFHDRSYSAYTAWPGFISNKSTPSIAYIYFKPTFHLPDILQPGKIYEAPIIGIQADQIEILDDRIILNDVDEGSCCLTRFASEQEENDFRKWAERYHEYNEIVHEHAYTNMEAGNLFSKHLRDFHLM